MTDGTTSSGHARVSRRWTTSANAKTNVKSARLKHAASEKRQTRSNRSMKKTMAWTKTFMNTDVSSKIGKGLREALKRHKLSLTKEIVQRCHLKTYEARSRDKFQGYTQALFRFCALIGDYDSMIILHPCAPPGAPPMNPATIILFVRYKRCLKGEPLLRNLDDASSEVKDVTGNLVKCTGSWKDPGNKDGFQAAVRELHREHSHSGEYLTTCNDCLKLPLEKRSFGCLQHSCNARLFCRGDPTSEMHFQAEMSLTQKLLHESHDVKGSEQLLPGHVRDLRTHLVGTNKLFDLMLYVIALVSIQIFLRSDEFINICVEHFEMEFQMVERDHVVALCLKIKGKNDPKWKYFWLYEQPNMREFCPVRHLLCFIYLAGIKGGNLFPTEAELGKGPPPDGVYKTKMSADCLREVFNGLFHSILQTDQKIGLHTFRVTAYLFAMWGGASEPAAMDAARHATIASAKRYFKDCQATKNIADLANNARHAVPKPWRSPYCCGNNTSKQLVKDKYDKRADLWSVAKEFVEDHLGVDPTDKFYSHPKNLITLAEKFCHGVDMRRELDELLCSISDDSALKIKELVERLAQERFDAMIQAKADAELAARESAAEVESEVVRFDPSAENQSRHQTTVSAPLGAKTRGGSNDLPDRKKMISASGKEEKLLLAKKIWKDHNEGKANLTSGARTWVCRHVRPAMDCLDKHFGGDDCRFLSHWGDWKHTTFSSKCCDGKGVCGPSASASEQ